jgi:hypothetical protein
MKKLLLPLVLLASATLFAQSPFDGTWMTKLDTAQFPTKPDQYSLKMGICFTHPTPTDCGFGLVLTPG